MNDAVLQHLPPEQVQVELWRAEELAQRRGLTSELDEMWSYVGKKAEPRWLWHAIDHHSGTVLAYVFGRRKDTVFLQLQALLEPFGITRFYTDGWGAYERHIGSCTCSLRINCQHEEQVPYLCSAAGGGKRVRVLDKTSAAGTFNLMVI